MSNNQCKNLSSLEELLKLVEDDKNLVSADTFLRDRYPIRFILFDNFSDFYIFVDEMLSIKNRNVALKSVEDWIDNDYLESFITHSQLECQISSFIAGTSAVSDQDYIIAPFSELSRFYKSNDFEALIRTIKGIESSQTAINEHQRFYIPIVGLEGKIESVLPDTQLTMWHLQNSNETIYKLVLTESTYGIKGLDYPIIQSIKDWLKLWKVGKVGMESSTIVCTSQVILANASHAKPDNAFDYQICDNAYEFLTKGLHLSFGKLGYHLNCNQYWETLASKIDLSNHFDFDTFVNRYFNCVNIAGEIAFLQIWITHESNFDRWLLAMYYIQKHDDYLAGTLLKIDTYNDSELFSRIALSLPFSDFEINQRFKCLKYGSSKGITLPLDAEIKLRDKLVNISDTKGYNFAVRYLTPITTQEKFLCLEWISKGYIGINDVDKSFRYLKYYLGTENTAYGVEWGSEYFNAYKRAKIGNQYTPEISKLISVINSTPVDFYKWYNKFSTTRTLINERNDIEVIYWVDGLGVDWISFISNYINEYTGSGVFLSEVMIARSILPTITEVNKLDLMKLNKLDLSSCKIGDLDIFAHSNTKTYPSNILEEFDIVKNAIDKIIKKYSGKKIAIVSDHGLNYLSQKASALKLCGLTPNHYGRTAQREIGTPVQDSHYIVLDDGITYCALSHDSLCAKTPDGIGTHGGCTPEEVLVPIFILSSQKTQAAWSAEILNNEISLNNPVLRFSVKNIPCGAELYVIYNNCRYELLSTHEEVYETSKITLVQNVNDVRLFANSDYKSFPINFNMAAESDDNLFEF